MKKIAVLGSTGSIGTQTLDIVRNNKEELEVVALAASSSVGRIFPVHGLYRLTQTRKRFFETHRFHFFTHVRWPPFKGSTWVISQSNVPSFNRTWIF